MQLVPTRIDSEVGCLKDIVCLFPDFPSILWLLKLMITHISHPHPGGFLLIPSLDSPPPNYIKILDVIEVDFQCKAFSPTASNYHLNNSYHLYNYHLYIFKL